MSARQRVADGEFCRELRIFSFSSLHSVPIFAAAFFFALAPLALRALTDEEKKEMFLKAQSEADATPKPKPKPKPASRKSPTPRPKTSPKPHREDEATPKPKPKAEDEETPRPKPKRSPTPTRKKSTRGTPHPEPESTPMQSEESVHAIRGHATPSPPKTPTPQKTPVPTVAPETPPKLPRNIATPKPAPTPIIKKISPTPEPPADITIEKSGLEKEEGIEPPPPPPKTGFWPWSKPVNYRYLTRSVIDAIRRAPVKRGRWQYIVVHNSGTRQGNAKVFDYYHRHTRGMPNGLAYHFVIGNGTSSGNGEIEIGDRWRRQINGGHVHSDYLNNIAIGICLVGDFNRDQPTRQQLEALEELIRYLRERVGRHDGKICIVKSHRAVNPPQWPTDCPGNKFPYSWLRRFD